MAMGGAVWDGSRNPKIITPCVAYLEVPLEIKMQKRDAVLEYSQT